jgi:hypothetical protein
MSCQKLCTIGGVGEEGQVSIPSRIKAWQKFLLCGRSWSMPRRCKLEGAKVRTQSGLWLAMVEQISTEQDHSAQYGIVKYDTSASWHRQDFLAQPMPETVHTNDSRTFGNSMLMETHADLKRTYRVIFIWRDLSCTIHPDQTLVLVEVCFFCSGLTPWARRFRWLKRCNLISYLLQAFLVIELCLVIVYCSLVFLWHVLALQTRI